MPVWHVSVSYRGRIGPVPFDSLTRKQVKAGTRMCKKLLAGVGIEPGTRFHTDPPELAIHFQKPLSPAEITLLPDGWMAIEAIDERGPVKVF